MTGPYWGPVAPEVTCHRGHKFVPTGKPWACTEKGCDSVYRVRLSDLTAGREGTAEAIAAGVAELYDDRWDQDPAVEGDPVEDAGFCRPVETPNPVVAPGPVIVSRGDYKEGE